MEGVQRWTSSRPLGVFWIREERRDRRGWGRVGNWERERVSVVYTETEGIRPSFSESISPRRGFPLPSSNSLLSAPEFPYKCSISSTNFLGFFSQRAPDENKKQNKKKYPRIL